MTTTPKPFVAARCTPEEVATVIGKLAAYVRVGIASKGGVIVGQVRDFATSSGRRVTTDLGMEFFVTADAVALSLGREVWLEAYDESTALDVVRAAAEYAKSVTR